MKQVFIVETALGITAEELQGMIEDCDMANAIQVEEITNKE